MGAHSRMLCQTCGQPNDDEREFCLRCGAKLLVVSRAPWFDMPVDAASEDEEGVPLEEHLLERISVLEEVVRRTAESMRTLVDYLYRTERNAAVSEAGVRAIAELLSARDLLPEEEIRELWERKTDERAGALDLRERFAERREAILDRVPVEDPRRERFARLVAEGDFHILACDPEKGLSSLEEALRLDKANPDLHLFLGEAYFNAGDLDRARPHLDASLAAEPDRFEALVYRGAIAAERGDRRKAVSILERAIAVEPESALPRFALGAFHALRGEWSRARPHLVAALEREETLQAHFFLGQIESEMGDLAAAIRHFRTVLEADPSHEDALYHLGLCYLERNWGRRAADCFERALALNPTRIEYQQASRLIASSGESAHPLGREAAGLYREAEKRAAAGALGEACSLIRRARQADPENPVLAVSHALLASSLGRTGEAISASREALRRRPPELVSVAAYVALLESLRAEGRHAEAVRTADEMLRAWPSAFSEAVAHYERSMAIADSGDDGWLSEAQRSAAASLRVAPREFRGFALEALGWIAYRNRDFVAAVSHLERAVAASPTRSALAHFGTALLAAGERLKAREVLRQAGREGRSPLRIEDRLREQIRRQVRLDESRRHEPRADDEPEEPAARGRGARRGATGIAMAARSHREVPPRPRGGRRVRPRR